MQSNHGIHNKLNKPLGNDNFNIWYHYGLAHELNGCYDKAISAYKKIGNTELADNLLSGISSDLTMVDNDAYQGFFLLFKGEKSVEALGG